MAITDPLLLSPDVVLVPVTDLPAEVRRLLDCADGDWAVTHPRSRTPSRIVDAHSAALLEEFRQPRTVVDAVLHFSRTHEEDPEATLEAAYPLLDRLLAAGFLIEEGSGEAAGIHPTLAPGDEVAGFTILECLQALEDTELYQVRGPSGRAALKIERPLARDGGETLTGSTLEREAAILAHLGGSPAPRLLRSGLTGHDQGRRFLAMEWCSGLDVGAAAAELRHRQAGQPGLLHLCRAVAGAYATLHERGVVHGDVHPRNVLVSAAGEVRLVDFGMARRLRTNGPSPLSPPPRGGIAFFYEPEYARAALAGRPVPAASPAGEQFAVAALLYFLITGAHRRDFPLMRDEMLRQIAEAPPLPFAERGVEPWPEAEAVLARALRPEPRRRYRSMAHFARALAAVRTKEPPPRPRRRTPEAAALLDRWLERVAPDGPLWTGGLPAPRASVHSGAAGIACALYRVALAREDPSLLAQADLWAVRATAERGDEAFYAPEREITPEIAGRVSPYHTATGPLCVRALVAHLQGDTAGQQRAVERFVTAAREPCANPDLTLGRSGVILAAALLLDTVRAAGLDGSSLRTLAHELLDGLWQEIAPLPAIRDCAERTDGRANMGMAHGWAGLLYTTLRWCRAAGVPRPPGLEERLAELADCALARGRGLLWPWRDGPDDGPDDAPEGSAEVTAMPGWCNGSAGFVYLWTLADRELGGPDWHPLAEGAAWHAWEAADRSGTLCCGLAGRAYALLHLGRHGGGAEWLDRARELAGRAAREIADTSDAPDSLFRGLPGVAALAADLTRPETAALPLFEDEGWG